MLVWLPINNNNYIAAELALQMKYLYGDVCYASIDIENDLNYPKNSGRLIFYDRKNYKAAIADRFVKIGNGRMIKKVRNFNYILRVDFENKFI